MSNRFQRKPSTRRYKKLFLIAAEGHNTEPSYFRELQKLCESKLIQCLPRESHATDPNNILLDLKRMMRKAGLQAGDEVWLVADLDNRSEQDFQDVIDWSQTVRSGTRHDLALSNPCFEYWIILHFDEGKNITDAESCRDFLRKHPAYEVRTKRIMQGGVTLNQIKRAIARASNNRHKDQPFDRIGTTVFRLIKRLLDEETA